MGYIKRLKENELVGGASETFVYPITASTAVYHDGRPLNEVITDMNIDNLPPVINNLDVTLAYGEKSTLATIDETEITVTMPPEPEIPEQVPVSVIQVNPNLTFGETTTIAQVNGNDIDVVLPELPASESVEVEDKNAVLQYNTTSTVATIDGTDIHVTLPEAPSTDISIDAIDIDVYTWGTNSEYTNWKMTERPSGGYSFLYAVGMSRKYNGTGVFTRIHFRADIAVETNFDSNESASLRYIDTTNCEIYGHSHNLMLYTISNGTQSKKNLVLRTRYLKMDNLRIIRHPNKSNVATDAEGGCIKIIYPGVEDTTYFILNKVEFLNFPVCNSIPQATTSTSSDTGVLYPYPFTFMDIQGGSGAIGNTGSGWSFKLEMNECQMAVHPFRFNYTSIDNPYENPINFADYRECYAKVFVSGIIGSVQVRIYNEVTGIGTTSDTEINVEERKINGCHDLAVIYRSGAVDVHGTTLHSDGSMRLCVSRGADAFDATQNGMMDRLNKTKVYYGISTENAVKLNNTIESSSSSSQSEQSVTDGVPVGVIVMWSGYNNQIPDKWALCNGQTSNGVQTPDLRGKFIYGAESDRRGPLGEQIEGHSSWGTGEPSVSTYKTNLTITASDLPQHTHALASNSSKKVPATDKGIEDISGSGNGACSWDSNYGDGDFEFLTETQKNTGCGSASKTFQISIPKPSFYTLAFIMKVKQ